MLLVERDFEDELDLFLNHGVVVFILVLDQVAVEYIPITKGRESRGRAVCSRDWAVSR
jgi:hypothetical protein